MAEPGLVAIAPGIGRDHDVAGFGLPPGIDDRTAVVADDFAIPHPGLGIDRLADGAQQAQAVELVLLGPLVAPLDEGADRRRRGVENVHFVAIDDAPEAVGLGKVRRAFVHQAGGAVLQRAVNDVAVPGDPADVGRAPVSVFFLQIEHPLGGQVGAHRIAAGGVHNALRLAGRSGGVEDVERMLGVERLGRALVGGVGHQLVPPVVAAGLHVDRRAGALVDDDVLHRRTGLQRLFDRRK